MNGLQQSLSSPLSIHFAVRTALIVGDPDRWRSFVPNVKKKALGQPDLTQDERERVWQFERCGRLTVRRSL